ncbi:hypothetical protein B0I35DRAFT_122771 [Stachybotrys elegans]|uniref:Uncharacterized protein n=1 Tax=Stachybotrys elegans TaxID=80388 RepID=A0A8K0T3R4_9HYPO|nr:hypothetical protein B0I35DRAFT_122771 [Stachybotrys elegans]
MDGAVRFIALTAHCQFSFPTPDKHQRGFRGREGEKKDDKRVHTQVYSCPEALFRWHVSAVPSTTIIIATTTPDYAAPSRFSCSLMHGLLACSRLFPSPPSHELILLTPSKPPTMSCHAAPCSYTKAEDGTASYSKDLEQRRAQWWLRGRALMLLILGLVDFQATLRVLRRNGTIHTMPCHAIPCHAIPYHTMQPNGCTMDTLPYFS